MPQQVKGVISIGQVRPDAGANQKNITIEDLKKEPYKMPLWKMANEMDVEKYQ